MIQFINTNFIFYDLEDFNLIIIISFLALTYFFTILSLTYFIYSSLTKKNKINYIKYISLIKDKDFIFFKDNLFKLYSSTLIILFIFLFKNEGLIYLLQQNNYSLVFLILFIYFVLLSNWFILFNIYLNIKHCINVLNGINFKSTMFPSFSVSINNSRSFSTSTKFNSNFLKLTIKMSLN